MSALPAGRSDAVFVSDIHLSNAHPATTDALLRFIDASVAGRTARLYILGDLFEYWAGDDDLDDPLPRRVVLALRELAADGIDVGFMAGNRDFLIGDAFADAARLQLLLDPFPVRIGDTDLLLSHGDVLCTDDVDYQRFRSMVRDTGWRSDFLAKPLVERRMIIESARLQSEAAKRDKAVEIMDVNDDAVRGLMRDHPGATLVHGHTHRPGRHVVAMDDGPRDRWVLPDWETGSMPPRGGALALTGGRLEMVGCDGAAPTDRIVVVA